MSYTLSVTNVYVFTLNITQDTATPIGQIIDIFQPLIDAAFQNAVAQIQSNPVAGVNPSLVQILPGQPVPVPQMTVTRQ